MKILYITNNTSLHGGANKSMLDICKAIKELGHEAVVVTPIGEAFCRLLQEKEIKYYIIPDIGRSVTKSVAKSPVNKVLAVLKRMLLSTRLKSRVKMLCEIIKKEKIDVVHTNTSVSFEGVIAAKEMGIPHIWHIREFQEEDYKITYTMPRSYMKALFEQSTGVICISKAIQEKFSDLIGKVPQKTLYNAISRPKAVGESMSVSPNEKVFVIVGAIQHGKGIHDAIEAFGKACRTVKHIRLWIVGNYEENEYYALLKEKIAAYGVQDKVTFLGAKDNVGDLLAQAYCGLMCSYNEGLGRVTVEYMLCEKPVIGARSGGTLEIVEDGRNGLFYEPGNTDDLAEKMVLLCQDEALAERLGYEGKQMAERTFSSAAYVKELIAIYEDAIGGGQYE